MKDVSFKMQSRFFYFELRGVGNLNHKVILKQRLILIRAQSTVTKVSINGSPSCSGLLLLEKDCLVCNRASLYNVRKERKQS